MALFPRSSGILLHPTSLPGRFGIGDLGEYAYRFVDWLHDTGQSVWQVLPLGPTSYGDSPYQTLSAFAGNPNLISLDKLVGEGWLRHEDIGRVPDFPADRVDYGWVIPYFDRMLTTAYNGFKDRATEGQQSEFAEWCRQEAHWVEDFALFAALKDHNKGRPWVEWPEGVALRDPKALDAARATHARRIDEHRFRQWVFYRQWTEIKSYANERGIRLFGDIPIFVAHDSADVWANRDKYYLDPKGNPELIAGVPPDYFSPTGQRWGNPLYRWPVLKAEGYQWWIARFKAALQAVDFIRIDHFRGFSAYWEIPASEETAVNGRWVPGPGADFFEVMKRELGDLPIVAEDLGVITRDVDELREQFELPGMKVLQFAWSDPKNIFLPHSHVPNAIVYSGTHDNNTTVGWWEDEMDEGARHFMRMYLERDVHEANWVLIQIGMMSVGHTFIAPMQDILGLGTEARMNKPGQPAGNWTWRFMPDVLENQQIRGRLAHYTGIYQRRPDQQEREYGDPAERPAQ